MLWLFILIPVVLLLLFGVWYDYAHNKSFKESQVNQSNKTLQNVEISKANARSSTAGDFFGF